MLRYQGEGDRQGARGGLSVKLILIMQRLHHRTQVSLVRTSRTVRYGRQWMSTVNVYPRDQQELYLVCWLNLTRILKLPDNPPYTQTA
jgi:hypothetical protein